MGLNNPFTLPNSGVAAGSYTNTNLTVNEKGIVTDAENGSGGGGGNSKIILTIDPASGSTTRFLAGMETFKFNLSTPLNVTGGALIRARMSAIRSSGANTGLIFSVNGNDGYAINFQSDSNQVFYRYLAGADTAFTTLGNTNDATEGIQTYLLDLSIGDILSGGRNYIDGNINFYTNLLKTGNPAANSSNEIDMQGNIEVYAITNDPANIIFASLEQLI